MSIGTEIDRLSRILSPEVKFYRDRCQDGKKKPTGVRITMVTDEGELGHLDTKLLVPVKWKEI